MTKKKVTVKIKKNPKKVNNAFVISQYYGFKEIDIKEVSPDDRRKAVAIKKGSSYEYDDLPAIEEEMAIVRHNREEKTLNPSQPEMLYQGKQLKGVTDKKGKHGGKIINLHINETPKSIAEAILIRTVLSILEEEGHKNVSIEINNIGGREAYKNFIKETKAYYRKNLGKLNSNCRQLFKDGPHALISCADQIDAEIRENAPSPLNFLSESNRNHFKEVVEYLESQEIPYSINKDILGDPNYSSHTIFTVIDTKSGKILATGSRCNRVARQIGYRKEVPAICVSLKLNKPKKVTATRLVGKKKPKFYFIQIGFDTKLKSLSVIDLLRKSKIHVAQSLSRDKLSTQLEIANRIRVPYILMMGQKEAADNTVVVRDTTANSQVAIPIDQLINHLKKLK